jgi:hypothetical protein
LRHIIPMTSISIKRLIVLESQNVFIILAEPGHIHNRRGTDASRQERLSITDIKKNAFTWLGEVSRDGGVT